MNETKLQKTGKGYSVATVGNINGFEGKAFVKDVLGLTSMEVSFGTLPVGAAVHSSISTSRTRRSTSYSAARVSSLSTVRTSK